MCIFDRLASLIQMANLIVITVAIPGPPEFPLRLPDLAAYSLKLTHLVEGVRWLPTMQHRMAVRTHGPEISNGIDVVVRSNIRQRVQVMNVREADHHLTIHSNEVETAKKTPCPVMPDALFAGAGITLIAVD
jgi:hypothetical protein